MLGGPHAGFDIHRPVVDFNNSWALRRVLFDPNTKPPNRHGESKSPKRTWPADAKEHASCRGVGSPEVQIGELFIQYMQHSLFKFLYNFSKIMPIHTPLMIRIDREYKNDLRSVHLPSPNSGTIPVWISTNRSLGR